MPAFHIRDAHPSDRDAIATVTLSAYVEYAATMPGHWDVYRESIIATLADIRPAQQIVAEQQDRIIATVLLYPSGPEFTTATGAAVESAPEVRLLAVNPGARGEGVGVALMNECIQRTRQSGAKALQLHTSDFMQAASRLYERLGFQHAAELDFQLGPDLIIKGYRLALDC